MTQEVVGNCRICGKELTRDMLTVTDLDNSEKAVYHASIGLVCLSHVGVRPLFEHILRKADKETF